MALCACCVGQVRGTRQERQGSGRPQMPRPSRQWALLSDQRWRGREMLVPGWPRVASWGLDREGSLTWFSGWKGRKERDRRRESVGPGW